MNNELPVVVIGAGPVGLAAAAHLLRRAESFIVVEASDSVGASVLDWGHVRLFSPWSYVVDKEAAALLEPAGWTPPPPETFPNGRELVEQYLGPLAAVLRSHLHLNTRVTSISRKGFDKMKTDGRDRAPFEIRLKTAAGEETLLARAVIDASGTWHNPNPLGASGLPARGEAEAASKIRYGIPDVLGRDRPRYAGKRALVVGSGHSAFNALLELRELKGTGTRIFWAIRRASIGSLFGGGKNDALAERGRLGARIRDLAAAGDVELLTGFALEAVVRNGKHVTVKASDGRTVDVDEIIATTGFRPDMELTRELRLSLDSAVESPVKLAPLIDPNVHNCGSVPPHGAEELAHPEDGFYVVGMKSYGRAPTFLMVTGYEQVRSVVAALAGDWEAARQVQLVLPETGVCSTDNGSCEVPSAGASCCTATTDAAPSQCCS